MRENSTLYDQHSRVAFLLGSVTTRRNLLITCGKVADLQAEGTRLHHGLELHLAADVFSFLIEFMLLLLAEALSVKGCEVCVLCFVEKFRLCLVHFVLSCAVAAFCSILERIGWQVQDGHNTPP